jgi:hypothetical protein
VAIVAALKKGWAVKGGGRKATLKNTREGTAFLGVVVNDR